MGFFDDLLLGRDSEVNTQTLSTLTPEQGQVLRQLLQQFSRDGGANFRPPAFSGELSAGISDRELTSLAALEQRALNPPEATADPLGGDVNDVFRRILQGGGSTGSTPTVSSPAPSTIDPNQIFSGVPNVDFDEFFRTNVQNPALENFTEVVRPQIGRTFGGSSFFSSDRANADARAVEDLLTGLTRSRADLALQERNAQRELGQRQAEFRTGAEQRQNEFTSELRQRQAEFGTTAEQTNERLRTETLLESLGLLTNRDVQNRSLSLGERDQGLRELMALVEASSLPRQVEQSALDRNYLEFQRQQDEVARRITQMLQALGVQGIENVVTVDQGGPGLIEDFLRSVAAGAGSAAGGAAAGRLPF